MKKSVVIIIAIIYVAAIALVSFFGLQFKVFDQIIPVESIEILNTDLKDAPPGSDWGKYTQVFLDKDGNGAFQIEFRVLPDNASNKLVTFVVAPDNVLDNVSVAPNGLVTVVGVKEFTPVRITMSSADNPEVTLTITLLLIPQ